MVNLYKIKINVHEWEYIALISSCVIVSLLPTVAEGAYADVVKLQTMRCLFEAYEHVLSLLENVFTPMFCHSDEVMSLLCTLHHSGINS